MKKRELYLDIIRSYAIIFVVLCHSVEQFYRPVLYGEKTVSFLCWIAENILFIIGRIGVPLFLAVTGTLLLNREYRDVRKFYKKSLVPLVFTTEIWIVLNYLFCCLVGNLEFNLFDIIQQMIFLKVSSLSHMWYMPMIIGIYIAIPFVSKIIHSEISINEYKIIYFGGIIAFFIIPTLNIFLRKEILNIPKLGLQINVGFWGGYYGLYLLGGYFISKKKVMRNIRGSILLGVIAFCFIINSAGQYYLYSHKIFGETGLYWYNDIAIFGIGMILFELLCRVFVEKEEVYTRKSIEYISRCSFGVYILHKPILVLLDKYFLIYIQSMNTLIKIFLFFMIGFVVSLIILYPFWRMWKKMGTILFHIK